MIRLENVTKTYKGSTVALRDVSIDIDQGEILARGGELPVVQFEEVG